MGEKENKYYERNLLRDYLRQYKRCKNKEAVLRERIARISEYKNDPLKSVDITGMPRGGGISPGAASLTLEIDSLMERVEEQVAASVAVLENVMDVLEFLPEHSMERDILERKYIDLKSEGAIEKALAISRSTLNYYAAAGLDKLLTYDKVRAILATYEDYMEERRRAEK